MPEADSRATALLDLPNELLNAIFSDIILSPFDVFALACTNRALNLLLIPRLLPPAILEDSTNIRTYTDFLSQSPSVFDVLSVAFAFNDLQSIDHRFDWRRESIFADIRNLTKALRRLRSITALRLDFATCSVYANGSDATLQCWVDLYSDLLNLALIRGCQALCINEGTMMTGAYSLEEIYPSARTRSRSRRLGLNFWSRLRAVISSSPPQKNRAKGWAMPMVARDCKYVRVNGNLRPHARLSTKAQAASSLKTLTLSGLIPVVLPCSAWTFSLLSTTTSLRSLTLSNIHLPLYHWDHSFDLIFPNTVIQHLEHLSIIQCEFIPIESLMNALSKMLKLTHLSLDFYISCVSSVPSQEMEQIPPIELPELVSLTAPSDFVQHILQINDAKSTSAALPKLSQVDLLLRTDKFPEFNYQMDAYTLSPIWTVLMTRQINATLTVRITHPSAMRLQGMQESHPTIYDQVTSLRAVSGPRTYVNVPDLSTWFAGFPALEHMAFENLLPNKPTSFEDVLVHAYPKCPKLETLRIGQRIHEIRR
ncbi:hypothetical protein BDN72DRAFT_842345 [Pluteus cervinus]|uniref:Uncharacterized protein n=1 Tax=Pluteus cervinus TaxID=181527 RepID=A0ACD3ARU5_9AGAR|nr:hypothetical protein BDN72DRAFT_842345 [Pluteus cervinus]